MNVVGAAREDALYARAMVPCQTSGVASSFNASRANISINTTIPLTYSRNCH